MENLIVIGLSGYKCSGKDEAYKAIAKHFDGVHRIAFGDFVKEELCEACGVSRQFLDEHKEEFRLGMQWWGTEFRRGLFNNEYWLNCARERLAVVRSQGAKIVIFTDCRFPNEVELIKSLGGSLWRIERFRRGCDPHPSETSLDGSKFDQVIYNNDSLLEFHEAVRCVFYDAFVMNQPASMSIAA